MLESARLLLIPALKFGALTGMIGHPLLLFLFILERFTSSPYSTFFASQPIAKIAKMYHTSVLYQHLILFIVCLMSNLLHRNLASLFIYLVNIVLLVPLEARLCCRNSNHSQRVLWPRRRGYGGSRSQVDPRSFRLSICLPMVRSRDHFLGYVALSYPQACRLHLYYVSASLPPPSRDSSTSICHSPLLLNPTKLSSLQQQKAPSSATTT